MELSPGKVYDEKIASGSRPIFRWYHTSRFEDFSGMIDAEGGVALSAACGTGEFETKYLDDIFDSVIGLDIDRDRAEVAARNGLQTIQSSVPPIPVDENTLDAVVSLSSVEHFPDERAFVEDVTRVLSPDGTFYLNMPIEVGVGGLLRHLGKNVVHPERDDTPDDWRRFFDYSREEFQKDVPREKHGTRHRYYNYTYLVDDLNDLFATVEIEPWPIKHLGTVNLALLAKASNPIE